MTNSVVRSLARKTGRPIAEVNKTWDQAKVIVDTSGVRQSDPSYFPQIISVTKNLLKKDDVSEMHDRYGDISNPKKLDIHNPEKFRKDQQKRDSERGIKRRKPFNPIRVSREDIHENTVRETVSITSSILKDLDYEEKD